MRRAANGGVPAPTVLPFLCGDQLIDQGHVFKEQLFIGADE